MVSVAKDKTMGVLRSKRPKLRILVVTPLGEIVGGAEESLRIFLSNALELFPDIHFELLPIKRGDYKEKTFEILFGKSITCLSPLEKGNFSYFKLPLYFFSLYARKRRFDKYDIIYANAQMAGLFGFFISIFNKKKLVIHLRQLLEPESFRKRSFYLRPECFTLFGVNFTKKIVNYLVSRRNSTAIAASSHIRKSLIQSRDIKVIYNAIDQAWFNTTSEEEVNNFAKKYGISRDKTHITFVGNLSPIKGVKYLIEAFELVRTSDPNNNLNLLIVGDVLDDRFIFYKRDLIEMIKVKGLESSVTFLGRIGDVRTVYHLSDIVVLPSLNEGFGRTIIEAMVCDTPTIGSNIGGIREIIKHGIDGLLVPPQDAAAIADAIKTLLKNKQLYKTISENAQKKAKQYNAKTYTNKIMEILYHEAPVCDKSGYYK